MVHICPTVTAIGIATFQSQLALVSEFAERIHIDIMDGVFTPTTSPTLPEICLPSDKTIDIHVMYSNPQDIIENLIAIKPNLVIIHAESNADVPLFATAMREHGIKTGLALLPGTNINNVSLLLPHMQHLLIFGGHLGYHGGEADLSQLEKVAPAKMSARNLEIGWDGGANQDNVLKLKKYGVDVINVGSCIHSAPNPSKRYDELAKLVA